MPIQLNHPFSNSKLLTQALTHRSHTHQENLDRLQSNERLEFVGDAVLQLWVTQYLYTQFPSFPEGQLTSLRSLIVCTPSLASLAKSIKLDQNLLLSESEEKNGGRTNPSILADAFEAVIGAIYQDGGQLASDKFLADILPSIITQYSQKSSFKDPKSNLQEIVQAKFNQTPHYQTLNESGPDHLKHFEVGLYIGEKLIAKGSGKSKQLAETEASLEATKILESKV